MLVVIETISIHESEIGPRWTSREAPASGSWYVPPPMKNW
jgi:hypothetical protein